MGSTGARAFRQEGVNSAEEVVNIGALIIRTGFGGISY